MTRTVKVIVLDVSTTEVLILDVEHSSINDLDVSVDDALTAIDRRLSDCSYMEIPENFTSDEIIYP